MERLILAYSKGIFPWFESCDPILWWSPDPRFVLYPNELKVSKSLNKTLRNGEFEVTYDLNFREVVTACSKIKRKGQKGTWITSEMIQAYCDLFELGFAKSIEVWRNNELVGGFYGVDLNNGVFCGESMFSKVSNASKVGFVKFIQSTNYKLIDCQIYSKHLESFGARTLSRKDFIKFTNINESN